LPRGWKELGVDLLSMAGHKLYAPKGIGVLYVCKGVRLEPLIHGAGHEAGRRAGTENILLDVALGAACELAQQWLGMDSTRELRDLFWEWLQARFGERVVLNGHPRSLTTPVSVFSCPPLPAGVGGAAIGSEPKVVDLLINQRLQPV
jgi:cysteine desulfurase